MPKVKLIQLYTNMEMWMLKRCPFQKATYLMKLLEKLLRKQCPYLKVPRQVLFGILSVFIFIYLLLLLLLFRLLDYVENEGF